MGGCKYSNHIPNLLSSVFYFSNRHNWGIILTSNNTTRSTSQSTTQLKPHELIIPPLPKLCVPKNMEIYMLSPIYGQPWYFACICNSYFINSDFHPIWKQKKWEIYYPTYFLSQTFRKQLSYELRHLFKHHLVIIVCDHFITRWYC